MRSYGLGGARVRVIGGRLVNKKRPTTKWQCSAQGGMIYQENWSYVGWVSPKTLQRWIGRRLPVYQAGPCEKVLVRPTDIDQFLIRHKRSTVDLNTLVDQVIVDLQHRHPHL